MLRLLTLLFSDRLKDGAILNKFIAKLDDSHCFYLADFIHENDEINDLQRNLDGIATAFSKSIPDVPIHVEIYLHPKYRNRNLDEKVLIACVPVLKDSLLDGILAFDRYGQPYEINAWNLPDNRVTLVLRVDESPKELLKDQIHLKKITSDTTHSYLYLYGLEWFTTDKGEPAAKWPPEYYTKSWYCYNSSCTSWNGLQVHYFSYSIYPDYWIPAMTSDADMNHHYFPYSHLCWGGTNTVPRYNFKVEFWERDLNENLGSDDFLDRYILDLHTTNQTRSGQYNVDADFLVDWNSN